MILSAPWALDWLQFCRGRTPASLDKKRNCGGEGGQLVSLASKLGGVDSDLNSRSHQLNRPSRLSTSEPFYWPADRRPPLSRKLALCPTTGFRGMLWQFELASRCKITKQTDRASSGWHCVVKSVDKEEPGNLATLCRWARLNSNCYCTQCTGVCVSVVRGSDPESSRSESVRLSAGLLSTLSSSNILSGIYSCIGSPPYLISGVGALPELMQLAAQLPNHE